MSTAVLVVPSPRSQAYVQLHTVRLSKNTGLFTHAVSGMLNSGCGTLSMVTTMQSVFRQPVPGSV